MSADTPARRTALLRLHEIEQREAPAKPYSYRIGHGNTLRALERAGLIVYSRDGAHPGLSTVSLTPAGLAAARQAKEEADG